MALTLTLSLVGAALADNSGSITVTDQKKTAGTGTTVTYEVYRIFDVAANSDYSSLSYTINSAWEGFFTGTADGAKYIVDENDTSKNEGKGYTPVIFGGVVKYIALTESNVATFGKEALEYSQTTPVTEVDSNTPGSFTNLYNVPVKLDQR